MNTWQFPRPLIAGLLLWVGWRTQACLWDVDTLQMERRRFPGVNELITGNFTRHSPDYYEWRLKDRVQRLAVTPGDPALIDDLAVAYDKLGRQAEGIAVLSEVLQTHPQRYETVANLGTLKIHAGDLETGAALIAEAIRINPDAHFGRERFQALLVRYLQQSQMSQDGVLSTETRWEHYQPVGFARYVLQQAGLSEFGEEGGRELDAALKGLLGILHFGSHTSPVVLEALGDVLLRTGKGETDARLMAARAYLMAKRGSKRPEASAAYDVMIGEALSPNADFDGVPRDKALRQLERDLEPDLAAAARRFEDVRRDERRWIQEGVDVDAAFAHKYYDSLDRTFESAQATLAAEVPEHRTRSSYFRQRWIHFLTWVTVGLLGFIAALIFLVRAELRRRRCPTPPVLE
jgi:tetratricopeptide (TPR) repeat protein